LSVSFTTDKQTRVRNKADLKHAPDGLDILGRILLLTKHNARKQQAQQDAGLHPIYAVFLFV
jgi:hypothetical protein